ncbi:hypothetical protein [Cellulomonas triticagri]|uniref:Uncharacterized protein n=1 Tax=Cellulomonas triticagri TaxID=2483352 RepID=A0A3M2JJF2_9CELL|nr:hypothetical protein [Cellulomonas triticagri]RMI13809.1 hypothetical protein EBM89_02945 [Cellulomonas triticagri]
MDVTLGGRMGGPEVGATFLPGVVAVRHRLKAALAPVAVDGVGLLDLEVWIGGSTTDHGAGGFAATMRYSAARSRLLLTVAVPHEHASHTLPADAAQEVAGWLVRGFAAARVPRSAQGLRLDPVLAALAAVRTAAAGTGA